MFWYFVHKCVILHFQISFLDWVKISGWDQWGIILILVDWKDGCGEASSKGDRNSLKDTDMVILFNDDNVIECWLCSLWSRTFVGRTKNSLFQLFYCIPEKAYLLLENICSEIPVKSDSRTQILSDLENRPYWSSLPRNCTLFENNGLC